MKWDFDQLTYCFALMLDFGPPASTSPISHLANTLPVAPLERDPEPEYEKVSTRHCRTLRRDGG